MQLRTIVPLLILSGYASTAFSLAPRFGAFTGVTSGIAAGLATAPPPVIPAAAVVVPPALVTSIAVSPPAIALPVPTAVLLPPSIVTPAIGTSLGIKFDVSKLELFEPILEAPKKAAIASKPLKYQDPKTGKAISGTTLIETFNGKKVTAATFYGELNTHERFLSGLGYDMQAGDDEDYGAIQRPVSTKALKLSQQKLLLSSIKAVQILDKDLKAFTRPNLSAFLGVLPASAVLGGAGTSTPAQDCTSADVMKRPENWKHRLGNSAFNVNLNAGINFEASCNRVHGNADGGVDATLFSKSLSLVKGKMLAESVRNKHYKVDFDVLIVGKKVFDYDKTQATKHSKSDIYHALKLSKELKFRVPVGPIALAMNIGVNGKASIEYEVKFDGMSALARVEPKVSSSVYAEAGADAIVAEAGAGAEFMLVQLSLPLTALAEITPRQGTLQAHGKLFSHIEVKALDGKIYAYVKVHVPRWGVPPWKKKTYTKDLVDWDGYSVKKTLFNHDQWQKLI